ncbi:hypothetical protein PUN28_012646 [Cardiocondyla obscurior]
MRRRFRVSNFQSTTSIRPFCTTMPIGLSNGWNQIQFNLCDFTRRAYGTNYIETTRMQVHANCRIRRIYFADRIYSEEEMPEDFKLFFPVHQTKCVRERDVSKKRSLISKKVPSIVKEPIIESEMLADETMESTIITKETDLIEKIISEVSPEEVDKIIVKDEKEREEEEKEREEEEEEEEKEREEEEEEREEEEEEKEEEREEEEEEKEEEREEEEEEEEEEREEEEEEEKDRDEEGEIGEEEEREEEEREKDEEEKIGDEEMREEAEKVDEKERNEDEEKNENKNEEEEEREEKNESNKMEKTEIQETVAFGEDITTEPTDVNRQEVIDTSKIENDYPEVN